MNPDFKLVQLMTAAIRMISETTSDQTIGMIYDGINRCQWQSSKDALLALPNLHGCKTAEEYIARRDG